MMRKRNVGVVDLRSLRFVSDPQVSPNGERIAFVHTTMDYEKNDYMSSLWTADLKTGRIVQFTSEVGKYRNPVWSPDGSLLLFTSTPLGRETNTSHIHVIPLESGKARPIIEVEGGAASPRWSPDGRQILFTSSFREEAPESDVMVIKHIKYKFNGVGYLEGRSNHLFTVSAEGGKLKQITRGEFDVNAAEWLNNSKDIAFIGNLEENADMTRDQYIYSVNVRGGEPRRLTDGQRVITSLKPSPKGNVIAYIGHDYRRRLWSNQDIWLIPTEGGESRNLTRSFDQDIGYKLSCDIRVRSPNPNPQWSANAEDIYFNSTYGGAVRLYRVPSRGGEVEVVLGGIDHSVEAWNISGNDVITYNAVSTMSPTELWVTEEDKLRRITDFNSRYVKETEICGHERFEFKSSGGHTVEGWLMRPQGLKVDDKYPLVLCIRGGSAGCFGYGFMHQFQVLAAQGWVVMYVNQWGNGGYNEEFQGEVSGHYGKQEYADLMDAVDHVLEHYSFIDPQRLGVMGSSMGGFLTNWIISHDNRFKAAIPQASTCNRYSHFGTSDIGWTHGKYDMEGVPWADEEKYLSMSPIRYVASVKTPTLIIHSELDYRCTLDQAWQWFTALKVLGIPSEMVIFPGESHGIHKPKHKEERLNHIIRWFKKYL
ncbi:MAG: S9 family peptidase [Candidatus Bathyarchaeota archaeon]|jgi:dipeptidyl aminopeptidase/acylaminoacyl peptidase|nr:S9 family peptidase [Candidatus Bathyarchaeota archaeon]